MVSPEKNTSSKYDLMSIISISCAGIGFFTPLIASIAAIVTGILSLRKIKKNPVLEGKGLAIAGIAIGTLQLVIMILYLILFILIVFTDF